MICYSNSEHKGTKKKTQTIILKLIPSVKSFKLTVNYLNLYLLKFTGMFLYVTTYYK